MAGQGVPDFEGYSLGQTISNTSASVRPELADEFEFDISTAEIAANSPRYRRKSSTFIDGVHDLSDDKQTMAPAQLYSTMSGRLFHSGRIAIVLVGPPARGKT
jgi:6-phosphofructo-2-kinase/fructose-2,6-biphosphatase 4